MRQVKIEPDFESWRDAARALLVANVPPEQAIFVEAGLDHATLPNLFQPTAIIDVPTDDKRAPRVPADFLPLAKSVACHADPTHWSTLYRVLYRLTHGEPNLLHITVDDDIRALHAFEKQVRFDSHKMKAFVRFRLVTEPDGTERYIAYHRSEHRVLKTTAKFFVRRFGSMNWSILTQFDSAHWDGKELTYTPGVTRDAAPEGDALEELWRTYYASIFNPARIKLKAMHKEMPRRYWATMPETELIPQLLHEAPARAKKMIRNRSDQDAGAAAYLPTTLTLPQLREAARTCRGCDLCHHATQTVFGEGPGNAKIVFVGEQPGDQEDRTGRPFVGPAGEVFDNALREVGIDRAEVYVTNAVKHFKFEERGTRRIHSKPNAREMAACKPWVEAELKLIKPPMLVLLGSTAAQSLIGKHFRITRDRGTVFPSNWSPWTLATYHPSALLRMPDEQTRAQAQAQFHADLALAAKELRAKNRS